MQDRYLVTGATGFIGSALTGKLRDKGRDVYALIRKNSSLDRMPNMPDSKLIISDITDFKHLKKQVDKLDPHYIYHLATYGVYRNQTDIDKIYRTNVLGTYNLLKIAKNLKNLQLLINTGSVYEYGSLSGSQTEEKIGAARNLYDAAKISTTSLTQAFYKQFNVPAVTLRPFTVYGPYGDDRRLIPSLVGQILNDKRPEIAFEAIRDFVFIDDVVKAYIKTVNNKERIIGETINVGSGNPVKIKKIAKLVIESLGSNLKPKNNSKFTSRDDSQCWANIQKAEELLNWKRKTSLRNGIKKTVKWHLNEA